MFNIYIIYYIIIMLYLIYIILNYNINIIKLINYYYINIVI